MAATTYLVFGLFYLIPTLTATPLDDYVNAADPNYEYNVLDWTYRGPDYTLHLLNMTSQKWLTEAEVDRLVWWHYIIVAIPDSVTRPETGFLYISGGDNDDDTYTPDVSDEFISFISLMAVSTGTICANLKQVPNQPVVFKNDPGQASRREDATIAWTWKTFVEEFPDRPEWLLRLPMTKAVVRAMDTMADFGKKTKPTSKLDKFMVCGESKRGWTTWTTGAVDKRVVAIAPTVMDLLNIQESLHQHFRSLGGWTFAFADYYDVNFPVHIDDPNTKRLADIVDPYSYLDRLTMPKYIVTAGSDEFFLPDDPSFYIDDLQGETYLRRIPNSDHGLDGHRMSLFFGINSFYLSILNNFARPEIRWEKEYTSTRGTLTLYTNAEPLTVGVQHARTISTTRRDFRLAAMDPTNPGEPRPQLTVWVKDDVEVVSEGVYRASFENPSEGWLAFFIEMTFPGSEDVTDFEFTTETMIIPNTHPFPDCSGQECAGTLV